MYFQNRIAYITILNTVLIQPKKTIDRTEDSDALCLKVQQKAEKYST